MAVFSGRPRIIFVQKGSKITPALIPNKVIQERAIRNGWADAKILTVASAEGQKLLNAEAIKLKVKADAIPCERCDTALVADDVQRMQDGSLAHMYDCVT